VSARLATRAAFALAVAACLVARGAPAQTAEDLETARALFRQGKELRAAGDLRGALAKLKAAHAVGRTPVTGVELARTHAMLGELVEAREVALDVARIRVEPDETERGTTARVEAAKLAQELRDLIPDVTVHVTGAPEGLVPEVVIDGRALPPDLVGEPFKVDPGDHVVAVIGRGGATSKVTVTVIERESRQVALAYPSAAPPPAPEPRPSPQTPPQGESASFVYGASLALIPSYFWSQRVNPLGLTDQPEFAMGMGLELGASLAPGFDVFARVIAAAGSRGKPVSDILGAGPGMSFRLASRWWVGATLYAGRADMIFEGKTYSTDWVFAPTFDISFAVLDWRAGQWLLSASPGYFFANVKQDNPMFFIPLSFGYRSY
jgi:hypothetical protein